MTGRLTVWGAEQMITTYISQRTEPPPIFYLALITDIAPTPYLDGSELNEPDSPDYARVAIDNDLVSWVNDSQPQEIANSLAITFTTATTDWGKISYWALCNAPVDGYNLLVGDMENPFVVNAGDQAQVEAGDLSLSLGPFYLAEEN